MDRKKILVDIYLAKNLGDDLFLDHLANSFPEIDFVPFHPGKNYTSFFENYKNIKQFSYSFFDKIAARVGYNKLTDYKRLSKTYDGLLFLGGGIFREESYWKDLYKYRTQITDAFKSQGKRVYFSGCSFGPYHSSEFIEAHNQLFQKVDKLIFRDRKSYNLFSQLENVSYAPDLLWSYKLPQKEKANYVMGISVIDPRHKEKFEHTYEEYIKAHRRFCEKYIKAGFQIKLFSFCEAEGDLAVAQEIAEGFTSVEIHNYTNDVSSYLHEIAKCSFFVAARFHAVIMAFKYQIPVLPVIYGDKTENLLTDLNYDPPFVKLDSISNLLEAEFLTLTQDSIQSLEQESKKHFDLNF